MFFYLVTQKVIVKSYPSGVLLEGFKLTLSCVTEGNPQPVSFTWMNISVTRSHNLGCTKKNQTHCSLILSNLSIFHSGTYECVVNNGAVRSPVKVKRNITVFG